MGTGAVLRYADVVKATKIVGGGGVVARRVLQEIVRSDRVQNTGPLGRVSGCHVSEVDVRLETKYGSVIGVRNGNVQSESSLTLAYPPGLMPQILLSHVATMR